MMITFGNGAEEMVLSLSEIAEVETHARVLGVGKVSRCPQFRSVLTYTSSTVLYSENGIFGIDGAGHAPSLYTKYYRAW